MTQQSTDLSCPVCGTELNMATLFQHEETQRAFARLAAVSIPLGARVMAYSTLFAPPKTRLTVPKQVRVILQLLPDLERKAITYRGRDWSVPLALWAQAIDQMLLSRDTGRLELPLKGHGYLHAILCSLADKAEASAEQQAETDKRNGTNRPGTVQVHGQTMSIAQGLAQVFGGRDPALAKIDADRANAVPMPPEVRDKLAQLRGKPD